MEPTPAAASWGYTSPDGRTDRRSDDSVASVWCVLFDPMQIVPERTSLVLLGIWNPAILNPGWLAQRVHDVPVGEQVQVQVEQVLMGAAQSPPSFTVSGIKYTPARNRLEIRPTAITQENITLAQRAAVRLLNLLPHTPIAAFGQNFEFVENHPTPEQLAIFEAGNDLAERCDFEFETVRTQLTSSIQFENRVLNLQRSNQGGQLNLNFNFHYDANSAEVAIEKMANEGLFWENLNLALRIIERVYDVNASIETDNPPAVVPEQPVIH